jgi:alanine-glyoxylate transaminase/serine-glyoxylate transaminase/serine-pyruvate transaminase
MVHPRVLHALSTPLLGHLDPAFLSLMDEVQDMLRRVFKTGNRMTFAVSGTGSAGMEAAFVNLIEPGDRVVVGINGVFGTRMADIVSRCGGTPVRVEAPWGRIVEPEALEPHLQGKEPVKAVALVHAETSTGVCQPLDAIGRLCRTHGALFMVDAVTSLGGLPVETDAWNIDVCYSATQKCLSCPPGLAPLTMSERAMAAVRNRNSPCRSWYLDVAMLADYWIEAKRAYHHTAPISMIYALREALRLVLEEGLEHRVARHRLNSAAMVAGLEALGLECLAEEQHRLPSLLCMRVPGHVDEAYVRHELLHRHDIEIGGGLGALKGSVWRIGLMGESSTRANVMTLLTALGAIFLDRGWLAQPGIALEMASQIYAGAGAAVDA